MYRRLFPLILAGALSVPSVFAAEKIDLTIYASQVAGFFEPGDGSIENGYAIVREQREVRYVKGLQSLTLGSLPDYLQASRVTIHLDGKGVIIQSRRLLLAGHRNDALFGQIGKRISVFGDKGDVVFTGKLLHVNADGDLIIESDVGHGPVLVRRYSAVSLPNGQTDNGSLLQVQLLAQASGDSSATLTYPSRRLGWRAAYTATLQAGDRCRMRLDAEASIANRSSRDWNNAGIRLVAGRLNTGSTGGVQLRAGPNLNAEGLSQQLPAQGTLDAYRSYTLPEPIDLPFDSITVTPLYAPHVIDCARIWRYENGNSWMPPRPMTNPSQNAETSDISVTNMLHFQAPETLPAGELRALTTDKDGHVEFIGAARIADTPRRNALDLTLGTAFDLRGKRERTAFNYDKNQHRIDEAFRISLNNSSGTPHTIDVVEHPNRWTQWTLVSSSIKPAKPSSDTLEFHVLVPANGSAKLDYALRYQWTAADERP